MQVFRASCVCSSTMARKSSYTQQSAERKAQMTRDRKTMRHLNKDKEKLAEYNKLTPDKKKIAKERYKQFGSFDEVNVIKGDKTADRNTKTRPSISAA